MHFSRNCTAPVSEYLHEWTNFNGTENEFHLFQIDWHVNWSPYFISKRNTPLFDERFMVWKLFKN